MVMTDEYPREAAAVNCNDVNDVIDLKTARRPAEARRRG